MNAVLKALFVCMMMLAQHAFAWEGYDYESGDSVEIEQGNLVREGEEIEYYDYDSGEYRTGEVESVETNGTGADVEVYDHETGEYRTFEME